MTHTDGILSSDFDFSITSAESRIFSYIVRVGNSGTFVLKINLMVFSGTFMRMCVCVCVKCCYMGAYIYMLCLFVIYMLYVYMYIMICKPEKNFVSDYALQR